MIEPVTIGRARLFLGDCLAPASFDNHVAALAKAYQVGESVCLLRGAERSERHYVVNGNARSNVFSAALTHSAVPLDGKPARFYPSLSAIGGNAANVVSGVRPGLLFSLKGRMARLGAKAQAGLAFVLSRYPRFDFKKRAALRAIMPFALDCIENPRFFAREGVCRSKARAPFVSHLMVVRHPADRHMPNAATFLAAKSRLVAAIWLHMKRGGADFAGLFDHVLFIAATMGVANRGHSQRQGDLFIETAA